MSCGCQSSAPCSVGGTCGSPSSSCCCRRRRRRPARPVRTTERPATSPRCSRRFTGAGCSCLPCSLRQPVLHRLPDGARARRRPPHRPASLLVPAPAAAQMDRLRAAGAVLFSYELFAVWELPAATAWIVLGYFALALAVDLLFKGASFCKHVCPIGQFNFVASTMSPAELKVRDSGTCHACRTYDCIKGRKSDGAPAAARAARVRARSVPAGKVGNLDCTFCLDCVHACPHDNIALMTRVPGIELLDTRRRSGIGRLAQRPDLAGARRGVHVCGAAHRLRDDGAGRRARAPAGGTVELRSEAGVLGLLFVTALRGACASCSRPPAFTADRGRRDEGPACDRAAIRAGADSLRVRHLARTLRIPPVHRRADRRAGRAERGDRLAGPGGARRSTLALGRNAAGIGVSDAAGIRPAWRVRIDRPRAGHRCAIIRASVRSRRRPGSSSSSCSAPRRCGSSTSRWRCAASVASDDPPMRAGAIAVVLAAPRRRSRPRRSAVPDRVGPGCRAVRRLDLDRSRHDR